MSKINEVRLININYNNNAIRISDESFHFHGDSTLISLRNGGGKTVLVQMMMAPFVHKRYRDVKDRPFESYFTTNKPSFILVEWVLDRGAGYVLTGMMVRRNQDMEGDGGEALEMVNFVSEYQRPCIQDIRHLPVVEKKEKEISLKNYTACRQLFETYKKDRAMTFFYYDMSNQAQSRQYFDKLQEYQINFKEWETIIKKVNLKESGLSELFADCKDEKGLVEKWFLETVESKLNKEQNRMKEFQTILEKYVGQYQDNQSKIKRRDIIRRFREESVPIQEKAAFYRQEEDREQEQKLKVAGLIGELNRLSLLSEEELGQILEMLSRIRQDLEQIEYEKLSYEIYQLEQQLYYKLSNRDMLEMEKEGLEKEVRRTEKLLQLFTCAKQQTVVQEEKQELEVIRQKVKASLEKEEKLKPERKDLGGKLCLFYQKSLKENEKSRKENRSTEAKLSQEMEKTKETIGELDESIHSETLREGSLKSKVEAYDSQEAQYNTSYQEQLVRNILGEYEPGAIAIKKAAYEKELEEGARNRQKIKKQQENGIQQQKNLERSLEKLHIDQAQKEMEEKQQAELRAAYEKELESRKVVLRYLDLEESALFDVAQILKVSGRKLKEIAERKRGLEKEEDQLHKEYQQLTQGKTLELPPPLEEELKDLGFQIVYGMEWLKKNGYSEEQNRRLVRKHPFLPYSLILSEKELDKLEKNAGTVYTSFPIPVIVREQLKEKKEGEIKPNNDQILRLEGIRFYMLFNENLLNEEKLRLLVKEKEEQIQKKHAAITIRQQEYQEYFARQELVKNQTISREKVGENERRLTELATELKTLKTKGRERQEELEGIRQELKNWEKQLRKSEWELERQQRRLKDFQMLCQAYDQYGQNRQELERCRRKAAKFNEQKALSQNKLERLLEQQKTLEAEENRLQQEQQKLKEKQQDFLKYESDGVADGNWTTDDILAMEARYRAITGSMSQELGDLEDQEKRAAGRYEKACGELLILQEKYGLEKEAWEQVTYDRKEERHQETLLAGYQKKLDQKQQQWMEENAEVAVLEQRKKDRIGRMAEVCGQETPLPKNQIQDQDFDARKNQLQYQNQEAKKQEAAVRARIQSYNENLTALAEYSSFPQDENRKWEQDLTAMDSRQLRNFQGMLVRDYNQSVAGRQRAKGELEQLLNRVVRLEIFQDDFYRKPLESMLELTDQADHVLRQLFTTLQSYESLMEKLEVDISLVEKEKMKIAELLAEYVKEVHQNLERIDANSTITIRKRSIKMLKITLPLWEDNENLYQIRIQDMIDEVTRQGLEILQKNGNLQEHFGARITTRGLYDTVVGIGNVQIKLYKIEAEREYPITWAEVAKNSGGEGFLSAFVILSSLLYYMRKDESDIFAERNEGKVLVMDNPFAQTNASHLLKPLMDMAKKTNTQLICLSGLGGDSIYNRFDNIYVLNLVAASLRNGTQYLKADHLRGSGPETMVVSQIEVMEQQELIF